MADLFADALAPPPPPKLGFAGALSTFFGGNPSGAYTEGLNTGSQYRLRSAQTEESLARAEVERAERMRKQQEIDAINKAQSDPNYRGTFADMLTLGRNPQQYGIDPLSVQEHDFRSILGDTGADPMAQFAAGQGVQGKVLPRIETAGGQNYNLASDPNMQAPTMTPLQQAQVASEVALTGQRNRSPASATAAGGWSPVTVSGRRMLERVDPATGEYESRFVTDPQMLGRERMFAERVRVAGESVADTLENISRMPIGASTGFMGVGAAPGKSILAATKDALRNAATQESVQMYTAALAGANRALGVLESAGLAPSGAAQQSFDALAWREWDSDEGTKLYKLAEMRQTVDNAMQTALTNPGITPEMKTQIEQIMRRVQAAIPFSPMDILKLRNDPSVQTLGDVLQQKGLNAAPQTPAAGGAEPAPKTQEEYDALPVGSVYIDTDGKRKRKR